MRESLITEKGASDNEAEGDDNLSVKKRRLSDEDGHLSDNSNGENSAVDEDDNTQDYFDDDNDDNVAMLDESESSRQEFVQNNGGHRAESKMTSLKRPVTSVALVAALRLKKKARAYNFNRSLRPAAKSLHENELINLDSPDNDALDRDDFVDNDHDNDHGPARNFDHLDDEDRLVIEDDEGESGEEENESEMHEDFDSSAAIPSTEDGRELVGGGVRHRVSIGRGSFQVYDCTECAFRSKSLINFKRHRRCHTDTARFRCGLCTYSSSMSSKISNHQRFHPNMQPKPMICMFDTPRTSEKPRGERSDNASHGLGSMPRSRRWSVLNNSGTRPSHADDADEDSIDAYLQQNSPSASYDESSNPAAGLNNFKLNYKCPFCPHKTPKKGNLKIHISRRHYRKAEAQGGLEACYASLHRSLDDWASTEGAGNGADIGGEASLQVASADDWQQMETGDIRCAHCDYTAPTPYRMRLHVNSTHLQLRLYQCPACDHRSNWRSNVCKHIHRFHPGETRKVIFLSDEAGADGEGRGHHIAGGVNAEDGGSNVVGVVSRSVAPVINSSPFSNKIAFHHRSEPVVRDRFQAEVVPRDRGVVGPDGLTKSQRTDQRYSAARPFMCSECKFRSAWRHSVQQHIRVNARCRDAQLITLPTAVAAMTNEASPAKTAASKSQPVADSRSPLKPSPFGLRPLLPAPVGGRSSLESASAPSTSSAAPATGVDASVTITRLYGGKKCVKIFKCAECRYSTHMMHRMKKHTKLHRHHGVHRCPLCSFSADLSKTVTFHLKHWHSDAEKDSLGTDALSLTMGSYSGNGDGAGSGNEEDSAGEDGDSFQTAVDSYSLLQQEEEGSLEENGSNHQQTWKCSSCSFTASRHDALKSHVQRYHSQPAPRRNYSNLLRALGVAATAENSSSGGAVLDGGVTVKQEASDEHDEPRMNSASKDIGSTLSGAPKMLTCPICGYRTEHKFKMDPHIEAHSNRRRYMCGQCGQRANWRVVIRGHIRICHPGQNVEVIVLTDEQLRTLPHVEPGRMRMKMADGSELDISSRSARATIGDESADDAEFANGNENGGAVVGETRPHGMSNAAFPLYKCSACGFTSRSRPYTRKHMRRKHRKNQSHLMIVWLNTAPQSSVTNANAASSGNRGLTSGGPPPARTTSSVAPCSWRCSVCNWSSKWPNNVYSHIMYKHGGDPEAKAIKMVASSGVTKMPFRSRLGMPTLGRLGDALPKGRHFVSGLDRYWCRQCKYHSPYSHHVRRHILRKHAFSIQPVVDLNKDRHFLSSLSSADLASHSSTVSSHLVNRGQVAAHYGSVHRESDFDMGGEPVMDRTLGSLAVRNVYNAYGSSASIGQNGSGTSFIKQEVVDGAYGDSPVAIGRNDLLSPPPSRSTATDGDGQSVVDRLSNDGGAVDDAALAPPFPRKRVKGRLFQCRYCPFQTYQTAERLLIHESLHGSGQRYQCRNCTYATAQYCNITKHLRMVHRLPESAVTSSYTDRELDGLMAMGEVSSRQSLPLAITNGWSDADIRSNNNNNTIVVHDESQTSSIGDEDDQSFNRDDVDGERDGSDVEMDVLSSVDNGDMDNNDNEGSTSISLATVSGRVNEAIMAAANKGDRPKVHRCRYCPYFSESSDDLHTHLQGHQVCERLRCPFCTFSSAVGMELQLHIGLHFIAFVEKTANDAEAVNGSSEIVRDGPVADELQQNGVAHGEQSNNGDVGSVTAIVEDITSITYGRA